MKITYKKALELFLNFTAVSFMGVNYRTVAKSKDVLGGKNGSRKKEDSMTALKGHHRDDLRKDVVANVLIGVDYKKMVENRYNKELVAKFAEAGLDFDRVMDQLKLSEELKAKFEAEAKAKLAEQKDKEYVLGERKNGETITTIVGKSKTGKDLIRMYFVCNNIPKVKWFLQGNELPNFKTDYADYINPAKVVEGTKQSAEMGIEDVIVLRDPALDNIISFNLNGEHYEIDHDLKD